MKKVVLLCLLDSTGLPFLVSYCFVCFSSIILRQLRIGWILSSTITPFKLYTSILSYDAPNCCLVCALGGINPNPPSIIIGKRVRHLQGYRETLTGVQGDTYRGTGRHLQGYRGTGRHLQGYRETLTGVQGDTYRETLKGVQGDTYRGTGRHLQGYRETLTGVQGYRETLTEVQGDTYRGTGRHLQGYWETLTGVQGYRETLTGVQGTGVTQLRF